MVIFPIKTRPSMNPCLMLYPSRMCSGGLIKGDGQCRPTIWVWIVLAVLGLLFIGTCLCCCICGCCAMILDCLCCCCRYWGLLGADGAGADISSEDEFISGIKYFIPSKLLTFCRLTTLILVLWYAKH